jgi:hypothetical protein
MMPAKKRQPAPPNKTTPTEENSEPLERSPWEQTDGLSGRGSESALAHLRDMEKKRGDQGPDGAEPPKSRNFHCEDRPTSSA